MTTFKSALGVCGLSQQEAADFFQTRPDTVKSWCTGRRSPPIGVWQQLASLYEQMCLAAEGAAEQMQLEGIDPRAFNNLEADLAGNNLPITTSMKAAGAMALLMRIQDLSELQD